MSFLKRQFSRAPSPPKREREVEMHRREMRREVSREAPLVPGVEPGYRAAMNAKHTLDAFGAKAPPPPATEVSRPPDVTVCELGAWGIVGVSTGMRKQRSRYVLSGPLCVQANIRRVARVK